MRGKLALTPVDSFGVAMQITIPGNVDAVREALQDLGQSPLFARMSPDLCTNAEIVLAEVLNNIVEHAYARRRGDIRLDLVLQPDGLYCQVADHGTPMPGLNLPAGAFQPLDQIEDLPEGGFGWFLIRNLTEDLQYQHSDGVNALTFRLISEQSAT